MKGSVVFSTAINTSYILIWTFMYSMFLMPLQGSTRAREGDRCNLVQRIFVDWENPFFAIWLTPAPFTYSGIESIASSGILLLGDRIEDNRSRLDTGH